MTAGQTAPPPRDREAPASRPPAGVRLRWKLTILVLALALLGCLVWFASQKMRPFPDGTAADFWYAACGVQVDPHVTSHCTGPVLPGRDGWFLYMGHDERGIAVHGVETYRLPEQVALAGFPEAVRRLERGAHLGGSNPGRGAIIDAGYRAWLAADPARQDAKALLACIEEVWVARSLELDRLRKVEPTATLAASAVAASAGPHGQPWSAVLLVSGADTRLHVFIPEKYPYSAFRYDRDRKARVAARWEHARFWRINAVGEFAFLTSLVLLGTWPWLRNAASWRWGLHLGLLPVLFFLPYWLGYAHWASPQLGPSGGVLYPSLIVSFPRIPAAPLDEWFSGRVPLLLYPCSYPVDATTGWIPADVSGGWFRKSGPGPLTGLALGTVLGLASYGFRRALLIR